MAQKSPYDDPWVNPFTTTAEAPTASTFDAPYPTTTSTFQNNDPIPTISSGRMKRLPSGPATIPITSSQSKETSNIQSESYSNQSWNKRQEELDRKERDLAEREEQLRKSNVFERKNNFPPIPPFLCFGPCFFQDISLDIPVDFQRTVRIGYYLWIFGTVSLFLNFIGSCVVMSIGSVFGALFIFLICSPLSYLCWFRPLYNAFKSDSSFNFMLFFFVIFCNVIVGTIWAVGTPWTASCGWITAAQALQIGPASGIFALIVAGFLTVYAAGMFYFLVMVHRIYRSTGASFNKAKAEFVANRMA